MLHRITIEADYRHAAICLAVWCAFLAFACATTEATHPGVVANNTFSPSRPPASRYGADRGWTCPATRAFQIVMRELRSPSRLVLKEAIPGTLGSALYSSPPSVAKPPLGYSDSTADKPIPEPDGRLCAVAEAFLGWNPKDALDQHTLDFVSWYFGLPSSPSQVLMGRIDADDPKVLAGEFLEVLSKFRTTAAQPRFGLAVQGFHKSSMLVLVLEDPTFEVESMPRTLGLSYSAPFICYRWLLGRAWVTS